MDRLGKIATLSEYKELQELKSIAEKRMKELKEQINAQIKAGKYGDYVLAFEDVEVKEYTVQSRVDHRIKVLKVGEK